MRDRVGIGLMVAAVPVAWVIVFPETLRHQGSREMPIKAMRKQRLKHISRVWTDAVERYPVFPASNVLAMVRSAGKVGWTNAETMEALSLKDWIQHLRRCVWMALIALACWTLGRGLYERDIAGRLRSWLLPWSAVGLVVALVGLPVYERIFTPARGYEYVKEYVFYADVPQNTAPTAAVGHDRMDIFPQAGGANVLFGDGHVEWCSEPELLGMLRAQGREPLGMPSRVIDSDAN